VTIWIAGANCHGTRFVAPVDERLAAFVELESAVRACGESPRQAGQSFLESEIVGVLVRITHVPSSS
jgi:hypothetical protein